MSPSAAWPLFFKVARTWTLVTDAGWAPQVADTLNTTCMPTGCNRQKQVKRWKVVFEYFFLVINVSVKALICRDSHCSGYSLSLKGFLRLDSYFSGFLYIPAAASVVVLENIPPDESSVLEEFTSAMPFRAHLMTTRLSVVQLPDLSLISSF